MRHNKDTVSFSETETLTTQELKDRLCAQLKSDKPDGATVRALLAALRQRDNADPQQIPQGVRDAWENYQESVARLASVPDQPRRKPLRILLRTAAAAALAAIVLLAVPHAFGAKSLGELMGRWSESFFQFVPPGEEATEPTEPPFTTDHPGLQKVHDTLTGLGVTEQVVPTRLPDGYELDEIKITESDGKTKVCATICCGNQYIVFLAYISDAGDNLARTKSEENVELLEMNGTPHYLIGNADRWTALWMQGSVECSLSTNDEKAVLIETLGSIYD